MCDKKDESSEWLSAQSKLYKLYVHDLKNPISALSANLSYLDSALSEEPEDIRGAVHDSALAAEMLLRFADNLNIIAMLEVGERCEEVQISISDFVRSAVRRNQGFAESAGVSFDIASGMPAGAPVWQNQYAELVVDNLLLSGIRHSPPHGTVYVSATTTNTEIRVSVSDNGPPIVEDHVPNLLSREVQAVAKKNPGARYGRGLGFYAAGLAVKALGGRIEISTNGQLVEFVFVAPLLPLSE
jgi:signal transduction histidine kinase